MIAIDTNILVRVFIDDLDTVQVNKSRELVKKAKHVYLAQIVLVELVWVFTRAYQLNKQQILNVMQEIYENSAFVVEQESLFLEALNFYKKNNADFSDCMILAAAKSANVKQVYTFDVKFSHLQDVVRL